MKNTIIIILVLCSFVSWGQNSGFEIGIEAGPSIKWMRKYPVHNFRHAGMGFTIGSTVTYNYKNNLSFKSGLSFERKGFHDFTLLNDQFQNVTDIIIRSQRMDYIILPVSIQYRWPGKVGTFIHGGQYLGVLLSNKETDLIDINPPEKEVVSYIPSNRVDFGLFSGVGMFIDSKGGSILQFELRYNMGITSTNSAPDSQEYKSRTNSLVLVVGLAVPVNKKYE